MINKLEFEKELGHPNSPLPNMKEITEKEWAQSDFFTYGPDCSGYRQIHRLDELVAIGIEPKTDQHGNRQILIVTWFACYDKRGIAFSADWWGGKVRLFKFAVCEHEYNGENIGNCLNRYTCKKCGFSKDIDSSG